MMIEFFVAGIPSPSGSKKAFMHPKTGKIVVMDTAKNKGTWQALVAMHAQKAMTDAGAEMITGPVKMLVEFSFTRPKSHFGTGKKSSQVKETAPKAHTKKPDLTKLIRCTEDALTGIVWQDDCQVIERESSKAYSSENGVFIKVWGV
jgi:Holliday junction resolvase RusA-like endonuclease